MTPRAPDLYALESDLPQVRFVRLRWPTLCGAVLLVVVALVCAVLP